MKRVFIDSAVLFSAAYSSHGYSRDLLLMAARGEILIVISHLVLEETRRNLSEVAPDAVRWLDLLLASIPFEVCNPSKEDVIAAARHVAFKDAPIVAAARKAQVDLLVTLDKKHLLGRPEVRSYAGMEVATPAEAMNFLMDTN